MTINNLKDTAFESIVESFLLAFENYYVKMPSDTEYYKERWNSAKVDFNLSYGMFDKGILVGFIIHAVDRRNGVLTAYNTGTGVIPEYRGKRIIKSIYDYAIKDLKENEILKSTLEVIIENKKAIQAYKGVGFKISKEYKCFDGVIKIENNTPVDLKEIPLNEVDWNSLPNQEYYSWDFQQETILRGNNTFYQVMLNNNVESYFIIHQKKQMLAQFDVLSNDKKGWERLFSSIKRVSNRIRIINLDSRLKDKIEIAKLVGLKNTINQFEMELAIT